MLADFIKTISNSMNPGGMPHPKALGGMLEARKPATDEIAVMVDSRDALDVGAAAGEVERRDYVDSWTQKPAPARTRRRRAATT